MLKRYLLLMVMIFISDTFIYAQNKDNTSPCQLIHEKFSADSVHSFSDEPSVKNKILPSIKASGSCLEIRIYIAQYTSYGKVLIINVDHDSIASNLYSYYMTDKRPSNPGWKLAGNDSIHKNVNFYLASKHEVLLQDGLTDKIKNSGIFTIPTWKTEEDKLIKNNQYKDGGFVILDDIYPYIEVKSGNQYRNFLLGKRGSGKVKDQYMDQLEKIFGLIRM